MVCSILSVPSFHEHFSPPGVNLGDAVVSALIIYPFFQVIPIKLTGLPHWTLIVSLLQAVLSSFLYLG